MDVPSSLFVLGVTDKEIFYFIEWKAGEHKLAKKERRRRHDFY